MQILNDITDKVAGMKEELLKYCGNLQQMVYARPVIYKEGRAEHLNAIEAKCGDLLFHAAADKALDITDFSYKGMNMTFLSKPGLQGRNQYDTNGEEALRSIMGGLFFTCGLENICAPCMVDGKEYPMHGRMRSTPAEHVNTDVIFEDNRCKLYISGEMREAELFGENMVLRRSIESVLGENSITIIDEVENQAFRPEPLMLMYHCNLGYPFLNENCRLYIPSNKVLGREQLSIDKVERWSFMEVPADNEPEYVFLHEVASDEKLDTIVMVADHKNEVAIIIEYNQKNLPYFMEWKSMASGDYVLGLEPSNSSVYGKLHHIEQQNVHYLNPFEKETNILKFSVIEGKEKIEKVINKIEMIKK